jgi:hypothetical protein
MLGRCGSVFGSDKWAWDLAEGLALVSAIETAAGKLRLLLDFRGKLDLLEAGIVQHVEDVNDFLVSDIPIGSDYHTERLGSVGVRWTDALSQTGKAAGLGIDENRIGVNGHRVDLLILRRGIGCRSRIRLRQIDRQVVLDFDRCDNENDEQDENQIQ